MNWTLPKWKKWNQKNILLLAALFLALAALVAVAFYFGAERERAVFSGDSFAVIPREGDENGVDGIRGFTLSAPEGIEWSQEDIRAKLKVEPAFSYYLVADGDDYILKPDQPMEAGALYSFSFAHEDRSHSFVYRVREEARVESCSLQGRGGLALDAPLLLTFSGGYPLQPGDDIEISPRIDGDWSQTGNTVTFQPVKWQAGTLYRVTVPQDTKMSGGNQALAAGASFSFETQDPTARIPASNVFSVPERDLTFATGEAVAIPVSYFHVADEAAGLVSLDIWSAEGEDDFVNAFEPLFSVPQWATLTRRGTKAETRHLDKVAAAKLEIRDDGAGSHLYYDGELPAGAYLFRLTLQGQSADVAVHISSSDSTYFAAGDVLHIWCHREGKAWSGATVTWAGVAYTLDGQGYAALPLENAGLEEGSFFLVSSEEETRAFFLAAPAMAAEGHIFVERKTYGLGEAVALCGYAELGGLGPAEASLTVESGGKAVASRRLTLGENGAFQTTLAGSALPAGAYEARLTVAGETVATTAFSVSGRSAFLHCQVEASAATAVSGEEVTFAVKVRDAEGNPVAGAKVAVNGENGEKQTSDTEGKAYFTRRFSIDAPLSVQEKQIGFTATLENGASASASGYLAVVRKGGVLSLDHEVSAADRVTVHGRYLSATVENGVLGRAGIEGQGVALRVYRMEGEKGGQLLQEEMVYTDGDGSFSYTFQAAKAGSYWIHGDMSDENALNGEASFYLTLPEQEGGEQRLGFHDGEDGPVVAGEEQAPDWSLVYRDGAYQREPGDASLSLSGPRAIAVAAGEPLQASLRVGEGGGVFIVAQLFAGLLPPAYEAGKAYEEKAGDFFGFEPVRTISHPTESDGGFDLSLATENLSGDYFLRFWLYRSGSAPAAYYCPVKISGGCILYGALDPDISREETAVLRLYAEGNSAAAVTYRVLITGPEGFEKTVTAAGTLGVPVAATVGDLAVGDYTAATAVLRKGRVLATRTDRFSVYAETPANYDVVLDPGYENLEAENFLVDAAAGETARALFALNLLPGDHLFQVMGQRKITAALGGDTPRALYRNDGDILSYQNADGGFSRFWGGRGDLLLSVLVAENGAVSYGEEALAQFIRGRIAEPGDRETLLLAYWGLSVFSDEMLSAMQSYCAVDDLTAKEKLILAQGLFNLGDMERARTLYLEVRREFMPAGGAAPSFADDRDQQRLFNAALLADLGLSLGEKDLAPFISELAQAENTTMTGRYLVTLSILRTLDADAIAGYDGEGDREGKSLVSLVPTEPEGENPVEIAYYKGDEKIEEAKVGDRVRVSLYWGAGYRKNDLYLVYMTPEEEIRVLPAAGIGGEKGKVLLLKAEDLASFYIEAVASGSHLAGDIAVYNLTRGTLVGICGGEGLTVK